MADEWLVSEWDNLADPAAQYPSLPKALTLRGSSALRLGKRYTGDDLLKPISLKAARLEFGAKTAEGTGTLAQPPKKEATQAGFAPPATEQGSSKKKRARQVVSTSAGEPAQASATARKPGRGQDDSAAQAAPDRQPVSAAKEQADSAAQAAPDRQPGSTAKKQARKARRAGDGEVVAPLGMGQPQGSKLIQPQDSKHNQPQTPKLTQPPDKHPQDAQLISSFNKRARKSEPAQPSAERLGGDSDLPLRPTKLSSEAELGRPAQKHTQDSERERPAKKHTQDSDRERPAKKHTQDSERERPATKHTQDSESERPAKKHTQNPDLEHAAKNHTHDCHLTQPPAKHEQKPKPLPPSTTHAQPVKPLKQTNSSIRTQSSQLKRPLVSAPQDSQHATSSGTAAPAKRHRPKLTTKDPSDLDEVLTRTSTSSENTPASVARPAGADSAPAPVIRAAAGQQRANGSSHVGNRTQAKELPGVAGYEKGAGAAADGKRGKGEDRAVSAVVGPGWLRGSHVAPRGRAAPAVEVEGKQKRQRPSLLESMRQRLEGGHFRSLNEQLYRCTGAEAFSLMHSRPELFSAYHVGFHAATRTWPQRPVDLAVTWLRDSLPQHAVVADFGCGEAELAASVRQRVHSLDLVAANPSVTACDMAHTPLASGSVDAAVFSLALMGTDYGAFLREAARVLRPRGWLWIAEVRSRFRSDDGEREDFTPFLRCLKHLGFKLLEQDDQRNAMFAVLVLRKRKDAPSPDKLPAIQWPELRPCTYKKR